MGTNTVNKNALSAAYKKVRDTLAVYREAQKERNEIEQANGIYRCSVCLETVVDPPNGVDVCGFCKWEQPK